MTRSSVLLLVALLAAASAAHATEGVSPEALKAAALALPNPPKVALRLSTQDPAKFHAVEQELKDLAGGLPRSKNDLELMEERARRIIQLGLYDPSFEGDLRGLSAESSGRLAAGRRADADVASILAQAGPSQELNAVARDIEKDARGILAAAWPGLQDAAGRLEGAVDSGLPDIIGQDAHWIASDISRDWRGFTDRARRMLCDAQALMKKTQP